MRGGQIVFHYIRMGLQVIKKNVMIFFISLVISAGLFTKLATDDQIITYASKYMIAVIKTSYLFGENDRTRLTLPDGTKIETTWGNISKSPQMKNYYERLKARFMVCVMASLASMLIMMAGWFWFLKRKGEQEAQDDHIRGAQLGSFGNHVTRLREHEKRAGEKSRFSIAGVPMPPRSDRTGIALIGAPGSGKSATFMDILRQQRALGDKNLVLDPGGEFTSKFYRKGVDYILSPRDKRSVVWDVWSEGLSPESYSITSSSLIQEQGGKTGDFFAQSARFVFEAVANKIAMQARVSGEQPSLKKLSNYILRVDDETLVDMVKHSDARSVLNLTSEKTAASIRATLSTYLQPLSKLPVFGERFSFKDWISADDDSWVFVPVYPRERSYFRPVITMWIEHYVMAVLSRPTNQFSGRRYNLHCDELPSYNKVPSLLMFLAEARKYSGNAVLGFQNKPQLESIYGRHDSDAIEALIATFCIFRANGTADSKWCSEILLSSEVEKTSENLSMGANDFRDSVGMNRNIKDHKLVTPSEIINLDDLELFMRFGRGYDVLKVKQKYPNLPDVAVPIDPITDDELSNIAFLDHAEATKAPYDGGKKCSSNEESPVSDEATKPSESEFLPPEYEEFAALITNPDPTVAGEKGPSKSTSDGLDDPFTRGF